MFGMGLLRLTSASKLHVAMSAESQGLRTQLLVGSGTEAALLLLTAACRSLHTQYTANQTQHRQRKCSSADMCTAVASNSHSHSNKPRTGNGPSCSRPSQSSNRVAGRSAQDEAATLVLPPDHQLMVAHFGEPAVAASEAIMKEESGPVAFAKYIGGCLEGLRESADTRWQHRQPAASIETFHEPEATPAALHAPVEPFCLASAAGLQLLLEVMGLLVADDYRTGTALMQAYDLLLSSIMGVTEAERQVFLAARGGLLVQVLRVGLQANGEREQQQQQQLEGVVEADKGAMILDILNITAMLVAESPAAPGERAIGETGGLVPL